jgi:hypothetical protein
VFGKRKPKVPTHCYCCGRELVSCRLLSFSRYDDMTGQPLKPATRFVLACPTVFMAWGTGPGRSNRWCLHRPMFDPGTGKRIEPPGNMINQFVAESPTGL